MKAFAFYGSNQRLFLLPEGEGQDEGERGCFSFIRKARLKFLPPALFAMFFIAGPSIVHAQQLPTGRGTDFTSSTYYEPPHGQQVRLRLSGAEASPLPGGMLEVKTLRVETFTETGKAEAVVSAPQCTYAPMEGEASSSGHLELRTADGRMRTEGDGFLWQQADNSLTISNNVHTVIKAGMWKMNSP